MVISSVDSFTHCSPCSKKTKYDEEQLKKIILKSMKKIGLSSRNVSWTKQGNLELKNSNDLKFHSLLLQMEEMGIDVKLTKKTSIEIG